MINNFTAKRPTLTRSIQTVQNAWARMPLHPLELILVIVAFAGLWVALAKVAGGPIYSDELWYIQVGLNDISAFNVMNRYFHIYLQKLFMELAPSPLEGVRVYWGFLVTFTTALVYLAARLLSARNSILHGLLAVVVLASFHLLADYSGVTVVDIPAMALLALMLLLYVLAIRFPHTQPWILVLLGVLLFLSIKTKETLIVTGILFFGFGFNSQGGYQLSKFVRAALRICAGIGIGIVIFILMNTLVLKDPLFGLLPNHFSAFANELRTTAGLNPEIGDWYTAYLLPTLPVAFLLFFASGLKSSERFPPAIRITWLIPLMLILFLSFSMIKGDWGIRARHLFPILPFFSVLAPQFLDVTLPTTRRERIWFWLYAGLGAALIAVIHFGSKRLVYNMEGDITSFLAYVLFPIIFSLLLAVLMLIKRYSVHTYILPVICIGLLLYPSIHSNLKSVFIARPVAISFQERIYPLAAFREQIQPSAEMRMLVPWNTAAAMGNPNLEQDIMLSLFNLYFDASTERDNFHLVELNEENLPSLWQQEFNYLLLTSWEWELLQEQLSMESIEQRYIVYSEPGEYFWLLAAR
jgi:hypothetical protein